MTRAMMNFALMVPWRQHAPGGNWNATVGRSRFIPDRIVHHFERVAGRVASIQDDDQQDGDSSVDGGEAVDLGARVQAQWSRM